VPVSMSGVHALNCDALCLEGDGVIQRRDDPRLEGLNPAMSVVRRSLRVLAVLNNVGASRYHEKPLNGAEEDAPPARPNTWTAMARTRFITPIIPVRVWPTDCYQGANQSGHNAVGFMPAPRRWPSADCPKDIAPSQLRVEPSKGSPRQW
jgi:hypothetical protein